jgi:hypothetical protein
MKILRTLARRTLMLQNKLNQAGNEAIVKAPVLNLDHSSDPG